MTVSKQRADKPTCMLPSFGLQHDPTADTFCKHAVTWLQAVHHTACNCKDRSCSLVKQGVQDFLTIEPQDAAALLEPMRPCCAFVTAILCCDIQIVVSM